MTTEIQSYINKYIKAHNPNKKWTDFFIQIFASIAFLLIILIPLSQAEPQAYAWVKNFYLSNRLLFQGVILLIVFMFLRSTFKSMKMVKLLNNRYRDALIQYKSFADPLLVNANPLGEPYLESYKINGTNYILNLHNYYWKDDNNIYFLQKPPLEIQFAGFTYFILPINSIRYYEITGDKYYENKISGGGSEGPNYVGAVVGNAILGTPGAIAGGQQKINPIESQLIIHDERRTRLVGKDITDRTIELIFDYEFHTVLDHQFPEKSKNIVDEVVKSQIVQKLQPKPQTEITTKLELLDRFLKEGVISQEEYNKRKEKLVDEALS